MADVTLVSYSLKGVKESFSNWISNLSPTDTPFTSMTGKEAVKNKYFQWQTDALNAVTENAVAEGSAAEAGTLGSTTVLQNVTQILRKVVRVSDTANAFANYGRGSETQYQVEKASKELKRDIEWALLNNGVVTGSEAKDITEPGIAIGTGTSAIGGGTNSTPNGVRRTKGFTDLVAAKGSHSPENTSAIVHKDVTTVGKVSESDVFSITEALYLAGAKATHIMFHPKYAKFFSSLMEKVDNTSGTDEVVRKRMFNGSVANKVNAYVSSMVDPLGQEFTLLPNRWMPVDRIYFFNPSDWTQMILREPQRIALAKDGSYEKSMIECELGLRHKNPFASGILVVGGSTGGSSITFTGTGVTQTGSTVVIAATPTSGDIDVSVSNNTGAVAAGSVVPETGIVDFTDFDTDGFTATIKGAGSTTGTVTVDGQLFTINVNVVAPAKTVNGKTVSGKVGGTILTGTTGANALPFALTNGAAPSDILTVTGTPAKVTWDASAGTLTIADDASGDITLAYTVKSGVTKGTTVAKLTGIIPKLTGFSLAGTATGATFDAAAKTLTFDKLADSSAAGIILTPTAVPAGATLGALSVTNADDTKAAATVAPAGKFTVKPVAVDTAGTTVTLKVAGAPDYVLTVKTSAA